MKRRRTLFAVAGAFLAVAAISAELTSAGASGQGTVSRAEAVAVVSKMDQLNSTIESCMVAHGATVAVSGSERSFADPGNSAWQACSGAVSAENTYMSGESYQAFVADQAARGETYADCMATNGFAIPGHNGVSRDAEGDASSATFQEFSAKCSDSAGLIRRNADGTGIAPAP